MTLIVVQKYSKSLVLKHTLPHTITSCTLQHLKTTKIIEHWFFLWLNMFLTQFRFKHTGQPKPYPCKRPGCGLNFDSFHELKEHKPCLWKCPREGCSDVGLNRARAIKQHQQRHIADDAKREAFCSLLEASLGS